jgi:hypothetical protein
MSILCLAHDSDRNIIVKRHFEPNVASSFELTYQLGELSLSGTTFGDSVLILEEVLPTNNISNSTFSWVSLFPEPFFWTRGKSRQKVTYLGVRFGWYYIKKYPELVRDFLHRQKAQFQIGDTNDAPEVGQKSTWGLHLRLGDYESSRVHHHLSISYYKKAIQKAKSLGALKVVVFSDDISKARELFSTQEFKSMEILFFDSNPNNPWKDLGSMSVCDGLILSNSTFSWWAGFLSGSRKVIVPSRFFASGSYFKHVPAFINNLFWRRFCVPPFWIVLRD